MPSVTQAVETFSFTSIASVGAQFRAAGLGADDISPALATAQAASTSKALRLAKGMLATMGTANQAMDESDRIIAWARAGDAQAKRTAAQAFRQQGGRGGELLLVHKIAGLPRADARAFMREHLDSGGDLGIVLDWLQMAGAQLRRNPKRHDMAGFLDFAGDVVSAVGDAIVSAGDAIGDAASSVADFVSEGVSGIVDAILDAGKTIAEMAGAVLSWTVSQVADLVESLIEAGKSVAEIMAGALAAGLEALRKFARAMIDAGRTLAELGAWALTQAARVLVDVFNATVATLSDIAETLRWAANLVGSTVRRVVQALIDAGHTVARLLGSVLAAAADVLLATVRALLEIGQSVGQLLVAVVTRPGSALDALLRALRQIGQSVAQLLTAAVNAAVDVLEATIRALVSLGETAIDLVSWAASQVASAMRRVLDILLRTGLRLIDLMVSVAGAAASVLRKTVQALFELGRTFAGLLVELAGLAADVLAQVIEAAIALGRTVVEFVQGVLTFTYNASVRLVRAAMDAGIAIADLLGAVASDGYFALRRIVFGILEAAGPLGDVLQWAIETAEDFTSDVWHDVLSAVRFVNGKITDALNWAMGVSREALAGVLAGWESIGERLSDAYRHLGSLALRLGDVVWEFLGWATFVLENQVDYLLAYLELDFIEGVGKVAEGLLRAGHALADLVVTIADESAQLVLEVVRGILRVGGLMGDLLVATLREPDQFRDHVIAALRALNTTIGDIYREIEARGEAIIAGVTLALNRLGEAAADILEGAVEIGGGLLGRVIASLLTLLPSFRPLVAVERADAQLVFGDTIDLDRVFISSEGLDNEILFGAQQALSGSEDSRAFVAMNLINFDVAGGVQIDDAGTIGLERHTFIHEMTHVWQGVTEGPVYIAHAIGLMPQGDAGYNYGYAEQADSSDITLIINHQTPPVQLTYQDADGPLVGAGGEAALTNANGDILAFNVEQQGQIVMHWFARAHLAVPPLPTTEWDPYIAAVRNAA